MRMTHSPLVPLTRMCYPEVLRRTVSACASNPDARHVNPAPRYRGAGLRGVVERITYQNPENGYTVARLSAGARRVRSATVHERLVPSSARSDLEPGEAIVTTGFTGSTTRAWLAIQSP